jgi:hypothetical protein
MKHTQLDKWTCASGKWMIPRHEWSPRYRIAHVWKIWVWICHQGTWELMKKKNRGASLLFFLIIFYFLLIFFFLFFFFLPFFLLLFSSHHIFFHFSFFFFCSSELLQHNTYIVFVRDDVMTSPPCLNDARPRA